jgi:hypothetical protein
MQCLSGAEGDTLTDENCSLKDRSVTLKVAVQYFCGEAIVRQNRVKFKKINLLGHRFEETDVDDDVLHRAFVGYVWVVQCLLL